MGFDLNPEPVQRSAFIVTVVLLTVAIVALVLRFVATRRANRKPGWEDWFAVLAVFFFIAYAVPFLYLIRTLNGRSPYKVSKEDIKKVTISGYVMAAQFCMQQMFAKLSLLFLYYRFFYVDRNFVRCIYVLGAAQVCWSIITYVLHYFECTPPKKLWEPKTPGHCLNAPAFLAAGETPNSLIDFALVGLAVWMVHSMRLDFWTKVKVSILFAIGGIAGIIGFIKIAVGFAPMKGELAELMDPIWAVVQQSCSCICCCAPLYKPLLPDFGFMEKLRSFTTRTMTRSGSGGTEKNGTTIQETRTSTKGSASKEPSLKIETYEPSSRSESLQAPPEVYSGHREEV